MSWQCTKYLSWKNPTLFQSRVHTTDENQLLRTCTQCRKKIWEWRQRHTIQHQAALRELNPNNVPVGLTHWRQLSETNDALPAPCLRRLSVDSNASFQHKYGFQTDRNSLDNASIPSAFNVLINAIYLTKQLDLGEMIVTCDHCKALHWSLERLQNSALSSTVFESCCKKGIVLLTPFKALPQILQNLLEGNGVLEQHFRWHICQYNAALTFTSMGCQQSTRVPVGAHGPNLFQVHGAVYYLQGTLDSPLLENARYTQFFFLWSRVCYWLLSLSQLNIRLSYTWWFSTVAWRHQPIYSIVLSCPRTFTEYRLNWHIKPWCYRGVGHFLWSQTWFYK